MTTHPLASRPNPAAMPALAGAALAYLLLTGLDAKSTAVLAGSLNLFNLKTVALDALLLLGFGFAAFAARRGRPAATAVGPVVAGAALWRGLDSLLDLAAALSAGDLQYWRTGQYATTGLLVLAALFAAVAVAPLARR